MRRGWVMSAKQGGSQGPERHTEGEVSMETSELTPAPVQEEDGSPRGALQPTCPGSELVPICEVQLHQQLLLHAHPGPWVVLCLLGVQRVRGREVPTLCCPEDQLW